MHEKIHVNAQHDSLGSKGNASARQPLLHVHFGQSEDREENFERWQYFKAACQVTAVGVVYGLVCTLTSCQDDSEAEKSIKFQKSLLISRNILSSSR